MEQLAARQAHNLEVVSNGSSPTSATMCQSSAAQTRVKQLQSLSKMSWIGLHFKCYSVASQGHGEQEVGITRHSLFKASIAQR